MFQEAAQAGAVVRRQLDANAVIVARLAKRLREAPPRVVVTCARGSSDHAATFAKYLFETRMGILVASAAPSVASIYGARFDLRGALFLAISQSGRSPDLVAGAHSAREAGALVIAAVNDEASPLAAAADFTLPLNAGAETSVAATKSYIAALAALVNLASEWARDDGLRSALARLPQDLDRASVAERAPDCPGRSARSILEGAPSGAHVDTGWKVLFPSFLRRAAPYRY